VINVATDFFWCVVGFLQTYNGAVTAVATVFIGIFTWVLACVTGRQARLTRESIDLARQEFIASHRPLLAIRFVTHTVDDNDRVGINFGVVNVGSSNANVVGSSVNAEFLPETEWPNPHDYPVNNGVRLRRFVPGATDRYTVPTNELASLIEVYAEGRQQLRLYGYIVYADDAQKRGQLTFAESMTESGIASLRSIIPITKAVTRARF
jgi:hypothetical protein